MKVGDVLSFKEIFHHMEYEMRGVFTNAIVSSHGDRTIYMFHAVDKDICVIALLTDWSYTSYVSKDHKGDWFYSFEDLFRICRFGKLSDIFFEMLAPEDSDLWNPDKAYHWMAMPAYNRKIVEEEFEKRNEAIG